MKVQPVEVSSDDGLPLRSALGVTVKVLDGSAVIVDDENERGFALNPTAREIWAMCDGSHTIETVAEELAARYARDIGEVLLDVRAVVRELRETGFLDCGVDEVTRGVPAGGSGDEHVRAARRFLATTAP